MSLVVAVLTALVRLVKPANGLHAAPRAVAGDFRTVPCTPVPCTPVPARAHSAVAAPGTPEQGRKTRTPLETARAVAPGAARIRPYAAAVGASETPDAHDGYPMPADASPVRLYVLRAENAREQRRADASRLGVAVLAEIATVPAEVAAR